MTNVLKWTILIAVLYIGVMAFMASGNILQHTQPAVNESLLGNQSAQNTEMMNLVGSIAPGLLLIAGAWVALKVFGGGD